MRRCSPGASSASGYSHYELHQRLVDSSSVTSVGSAASRCRSGPHERVGDTAKCQKECAFSTREDHFPWRGMGLNVDAGAPVTVTYRVHPVSCEENKARPVTHCQTVSETVRFYGSSIQRDTFWTVVHETPAVVAQDQRVFPEEQPLSHDQGHMPMLSCLGNVEETLVPVPGSHVGSFMSSQDAKNRCLSHGLGSDLRGTIESGSVEGQASLMAHQPSGDVGCISCSQEFSSRFQGPPCACPLRQHIGGLLNKSPGGFTEFGQAQVDLFASREMSHCHSGSPSCIQLLSEWTRWCRRGRGFVCMHFPRLLCSRESWREFAGTGFYYFSLPRSGRAEYGSQK